MNQKLLLGMLLIISACHIKKQYTSNDGFEEDQEARINWENQLLADPVTGKIPEHVRGRELAFASSLPSTSDANKNGEYLDGYTWQNIGPWNVGGRTRALAIDVVNENIIIAAGVTGGIWKSNNGGTQWYRTTLPGQFPGVTCIMQDTRSGKTNTWYAGTGELYGSSGSGGGAYYSGNGLYKSTDNGESWLAVAKTNSTNPTFNSNWDGVWNLALDPTDTADVIYAATYSTIYKSTDGGKSFKSVRGGSGLGGNISYATDVVVTPKGTTYAVLSAEGPQAGVWRLAKDSIVWRNIIPANFNPDYNRVVLCCDPNDENVLYFLGNTDSTGKKVLNFKKDAEYNMLWKYKYLSGSGASSGGQWADLSQSLPDIQGEMFGIFNTQKGYDMYVRVKPGSPNTIILGATNVWRSTDGFITPNNTTWIGGYGPGSSLPNYTEYDNHHPDNHNLVFYKSNPDKMLSSHDGGLSRTLDNTANKVVWEDLNHGYLTTQFYTVSMDKSPTGTFIMGGLQDNGTYATINDANDTFTWPMPFNGDGSYCYVPDGAADLYVSKQEGKVYHIQVDATGNATKYARIDPAQADQGPYSFINPFTCDPNKQNRMYLPNGDKLWRNDDVNQIPLKTQLDSNRVSTGWVLMDSCTVAGQDISAVTVSKTTNDLLAYATNKGKIYKMANASQAGSSVVEITGGNFPAGGNINCLAMHPSNADQMIAVFTNYNISSLFYTKDGGSTWSDVSGNLENNPNNSFVGPSCRWAVIIPINGFTAYLVATSVGLFSTDTLKGSSTRWVQQGKENIGNYPCTMIDFRESDKKVIVATHGSGVFRGYLDSRSKVLGVKTSQDENLISIYPNPAKDLVNISLSKLQGNLTIELYDAQGRKVADVYTGPAQELLQYNTSALPTGSYLLRIGDGKRSWGKLIEVGR